MRAGQIVCAINADATTANDDPLCAPLNPFGLGNVSRRCARLRRRRRAT
jgi:iron complex outermembrane receptor protein